ncbi:MAG: NUDIX domain-containing protein [Planctomycetota bacterium]
MDAAQRELLTWYAANRRDLPWRQTRDPYRVLVSEVMLQQTQVARVIPFYERFLALFPDERALATAADEVIHRAWKGLGYPSRVERLRATCRAVIARGNWPRDLVGLQELPGIGPYTARALAAFAFAHPSAVLDTNVARVLSRRDGLRLGGTTVDRSAFQVAADAALATSEPIAWNNAMMELGALVCSARNPRCAVCPWARRCVDRADAAALVASAAPLKVASTKIQYGDPAPPRSTPVIKVVVALIHHEGKYLAARRPVAKHAGGGWELPGGKVEAGEDERRAIAREVAEEVGAEVLAARHLLTWHHTYPDRHLRLSCYRVRLFAPTSVRALASDGLAWFTPAEFIALNFPPGTAPLLQRLAVYHRLGKKKQKA